MGGNEGVDGDVSGEEAAWRDLIARFDLPVDTQSTQAPWPARENLTETARDRPLPDRDGTGRWEESGPAGPGRSGPSHRAGPASLPGPASLTGPVHPPGQDGWRTDPAAGGPDVAGPAAADPATGSWDTGSPGGAGPDVASPDAASPGGASPDGTSSAGAGRHSAAGPRPGGTSPGENGSAPGGGAPPAEPPRGGHRAPSGPPGHRARIVRRAGPVPRPAPPGDDEEDDNRYRPPPPEPLPNLDPVAKGAWAGLLGGPGYLLAWTILGWQVSDWAALVAIVAFIAGFAILVLRLGDRPRDDDDDGAVV